MMADICEALDAQYQNWTTFTYKSKLILKSGFCGSLFNLKSKSKWIFSRSRLNFLHLKCGAHLAGWALLQAKALDVAKLFCKDNNVIGEIILPRKEIGVQEKVSSTL